MPQVISDFPNKTTSPHHTGTRSEQKLAQESKHALKRDMDEIWSKTCSEQVTGSRPNNEEAVAEQLHSDSLDNTTQNKKDIFSQSTLRFFDGRSQKTGDDSIDDDVASFEHTDFHEESSMLSGLTLENSEQSSHFISDPMDRIRNLGIFNENGRELFAKTRTPIKKQNNTVKLTFAKSAQTASNLAPTKQSAAIKQKAESDRGERISHARGMIKATF